MEIERLGLEGLLLIKPRVFVDKRGYFLESYRQNLYAEAGIDVTFVQDNASFSRHGILRGLHYQETPGQAKLISVVQGRIWDVAVDIRPTSKTFRKWVGIELNEDNHWQLFIPIGFAHGYCILSETARVSYKVSATYDPATERTLRWDDPTFGITWPIQNPILSERDSKDEVLKEV